MTKEEFLKGVENWDNHRYLLWPALECTKGQILELGMGQGSTPFLASYAHDTKRELISFESNLEWYEKMFPFYGHEIHFVNNWDDVSINYPSPDVVLIDHAPGERRHIDIQRFANSAKLIVIHDSEQEATGYMLSKIWHLFKYRIDWKSEGAWASCVSNFIDVTKWEIN